MPSADPQDCAIDRESEGEVGDEPVLADLGPVGKPALDHVPAERALHEAEQQDPGERQRQPPRQPPPRQKPENGTAKTTPISRPNSRCTYSQK